MNREKLNIAVLIGGILFLVFYWTHTAFVKAGENAKAEEVSLQEKTEKAYELYAKTLHRPGSSEPVEDGLLSFVEKTAKMTGTSERLSELKPKHSEAAEAVSFRLDSLTQNEMAEFIKNMEEHPNIKLASVKISKRFDNEKRLNLIIEAEKI